VRDEREHCAPSNEPTLVAHFFTGGSTFTDGPTFPTRVRRSSGSIGVGPRVDLPPSSNQSRAIQAGPKGSRLRCGREASHAARAIRLWGAGRAHGAASERGDGAGAQLGSKSQRVRRACATRRRRWGRHRCAAGGHSPKRDHVRVTARVTSDVVVTLRATLTDGQKHQWQFGFGSRMPILFYARSPKRRDAASSF